LVEGLRAGQPLGALLGARLEEAVLAAAAAPAAGYRVVDALRGAFPSRIGRLHPSGRTPGAEAAPSVCDGLAALDGATPTGLAPEEVAVLTTAREGVGGLLDALGDLLLAEGVHQLAQRNPSRAAAATDAISGAGSPPPLPEVVEQPFPGTATTHRVVLIAPEPRLPRRCSPGRPPAWPGCR
jgi:hypothetical protein